MPPWGGRGRTIAYSDGWAPRRAPPFRCRVSAGLKPSEAQSKAWKGELAVARLSSLGSPSRSPAPFSAESTENGSQLVGLTVTFGRSM